MSKIESKMAIIDVLKTAKTPLSSSELQKELGTYVTIRSLSRRLHELLEAGVVQKLGRGRSTRYQVKPENTPSETVNPIFSPSSTKALTHVTQPIYLRDPVSYHTHWLSSYEPNKTFYLSSSQREDMHSMGARTQFGIVAGTYARHIYNRLLIDLSYNSSRLEGNTYSLIDTEKLVIEGIEVSNKLNEEKIMILNHKEAIRYLIDNASQLLINENTICTIHFLLSDGLLLKQHSGELRTHGVKIGGSTYLPLENQARLRSALITLCQKASLITDPYEQSFFLLVHLSYLQAFEDCNKRTSRLSANIPLIQKNLVPLSFNDIPKDDYINAMLAIYELNDIGPLAELYHFSYMRTCKVYDSTVQSIGFDRIRVVYREQRRTLTAHVIRHRLKGNKIKAYVSEQITYIIPATDQEAFATVMHEDIELLTFPRVAGMGITNAEFEAWKATPNVD